MGVALFATRAQQRAATAAERRAKDLDRLERRVAELLDEAYRGAYRMVLDAAKVDLGALEAASREAEGAADVRGHTGRTRDLWARLRGIGMLLGEETAAIEAVTRIDDPAAAQAALEGLKRVAMPGFDQLDAILDELQRQGAVELVEQMEAAAEVPLEELRALTRPERFEGEALRSALRVTESIADSVWKGVGRRIADTIGAGLERGLTDSQIADLLARRLPLAFQRDAYTIARTETTRIYNLGRVQLGDEAGDYLWGYRYDVIVDPRTTKLCQRIAGTLVAKAELTWVPPFHFNCRTTLTPIMAPRYGGPARPRTTVPEGFRPEPMWVGVGRPEPAEWGAPA